MPWPNAARSWSVSPETVGCGGYGTGATDVSLFFQIIQGLSGSDTVHFVVMDAQNNYQNVLRITFWPGNPPPKGAR
jgi:hypothetical protein